MSLVVTEAPSTEPVTTAEAKAQLNVTHSADDDYIAALIVAARRVVEARTHIFIMPHTVTLFLDVFPDADDPLNVWPIRSISSVKYDDTAGVEQTVDAADYHSDIYTLGGLLVADTCWPTPDTKPNAVRIAVAAGYADAASVPADLKHAILLMIAHLYANREPVAVGLSVEKIPYSVDYLLGSYVMPV